MKREIKFRAYHIPTKRMFDVFSWCKDCVFEDSEDGIGTSPTLPAEMKDCELMQFTGLKDIHGKKIFEGDILKTKFGNKIWFSDLIDYHLWNIQNSNAFSQIEIIGNIYENPELL